MFELIASVTDIVEVAPKGGEEPWTAVAAAAAVGGVVATVVTTALSAWIRSRNRPEPEWEVTKFVDVGTNDELGEHIGIRWGGSITNIGDGVAFQLRVATNEGAIANVNAKGERSKAVLPYMRTGDSADFSVKAGLDDWEGMELIISWVEPPTRLRKLRSYKIDLTADIGRPIPTFRKGDVWGSGPEITRQEWEQYRLEQQTPKPSGQE